MSSFCSETSVTISHSAEPYSKEGYYLKNPWKNIAHPTTWNFPEVTKQNIVTKHRYNHSHNHSYKVQKYK